MVKILLDEMDTGMKPYLQALELSVVTVPEVKLEGKDDIDVVDYAKNNNMLVVTRDSRVAGMAELKKVRFIEVNTLFIAQAVSDAIEKNYPDLK